MTMEELKNKIENKIEELENDYSICLKRLDEATNKGSESYYDIMLIQIKSSIVAYRSVLEMMNESEEK